LAARATVLPVLTSGRRAGPARHLLLPEGACEPDPESTGIGIKVRSVGRVAWTQEALKVLGESLLSSDRVVLEVTGSAWEIVRIWEPIVEVGHGRFKRAPGPPLPRAPGIASTLASAGPAQ
jgi:hypothetical protein